MLRFFVFVLQLGAGHVCVRNFMPCTIIHSLSFYLLIYALHHGSRFSKASATAKLYSCEAETDYRLRLSKTGS